MDTTNGKVQVLSSIQIQVGKKTKGWWENIPELMTAYRPMPLLRNPGLKTAPGN
jgi:hypothetical protein